MNATYLRSLTHSQPIVVEGVVADTMTILVGDLVCISAGLINKVSASAHTLIFGIALDAITTTTHTTASTCKVLLLDEWSVIRMAYTGTASNLVEADVWTTAYDVSGTTTQLVNIDDSSGGFLIPTTLLAANKTGYIDCVVKASALWNA